jgi:hypothetical protein
MPQIILLILPPDQAQFPRTELSGDFGGKLPTTQALIPSNACAKIGQPLVTERRRILINPPMLKPRRRLSAAASFTPRDRKDENARASHHCTRQLSLKPNGIVDVGGQEAGVLDEELQHFHDLSLQNFDPYRGNAQSCRCAKTIMNEDGAASLAVR